VTFAMGPLHFLLWHCKKLFARKSFHNVKFEIETLPVYAEIYNLQQDDKLLILKLF